MSDLAEFLTARYDEREQIALAAGGGHWQSGCRQVTHDDCDNRMGDCERIYGPDMTIYASGGHTPAQAAHIALNDPMQALREVEAGRKRLSAYRDAVRMVAELGPDRIIEAILAERLWACQQDASVFSGHSGYKPEWKM